MNHNEQFIQCLKEEKCSPVENHEWIKCFYTGKECIEDNCVKVNKEGSNA